MDGQLMLAMIKEMLEKSEFGELGLSSTSIQKSGNCFLLVVEVPSEMKKRVLHIEITDMGVRK